MHNGGFFHDEAVSVEFADVLTGIGIADFGGLVGVKPDLALAATDYGSSEALLRPEIDPVVSLELVEVEREGENITSCDRPRYIFAVDHLIVVEHLALRIHSGSRLTYILTQNWRVSDD